MERNKKNNIFNILIIIISGVVTLFILIAIVLDIYARIKNRIDASTFWSILSAIVSIGLTFAAIIYTVISGAKLDKKIDKMAFNIAEWQKQKPEIEQALAELNLIDEKGRTKEQVEKLNQHQANLKESLKSFLDD